MIEESIVASDGLKFLAIRESFFISGSGSQAIIRPLQMETDKWVVAASDFLEPEGTVRILTENDCCIMLSARTETAGMDGFSKCFLIIFTEQLPVSLAQKIMQMKKTVRSCSRRSEERFDVGIKNYGRFGLSAAVQFLRYRTQKIKCMVNNVSVHGAMVTSGRLGVLQGERLHLLFSFSNPDEKLILPALVAGIRHVSDEYECLSLRLSEPLSFLWQQRILRYADLVQKEN